MIGRLGGHLGPAVSALVDGQLDPAAAERAWDHVVHCGHCRAQVERELWVKRRLGTLCGNEPSARLLGSLHSISQGISEDISHGSAGDLGHAPSTHAWQATAAIEHRARTRRRTGLAVAGAGSVSAAVLGFAALGPLGSAGSPAAQIGGGTSSQTPTSVPASPPPSAVMPTALRLEGRLPAWLLGDSEAEPGGRAERPPQRMENATRVTSALVRR